MKNSIILRQIARDEFSLDEYFQQKTPSFTDIYRRMVLLERSTDTELPDHYYQNASEYTLKDIKSVWQLMTLGLARLGQNYLEIRRNTVYVKADKLSVWQDQLTLCPPLILISALLWRDNYTHLRRDTDYLREFLKKYIRPNVRYTAYPSPYMPQMEAFLKKSGFIDLHIHLNGTTETDTVWQYFLKNPYATSRTFDQVKKHTKVIEQVEQEGNLLTPNILFQRLRAAQRLRRKFVHILFGGRLTPELNDYSEKKTDEKKDENENDKSKQNKQVYLEKNNLFGTNDTLRWKITDDARHPMGRLFSRNARLSLEDEVCLESLLYILMLDKIFQDKNDYLAGLFHQYLLLLGFVNRFLVQNHKSRGFDQFQKFTMNGFRHKAEEDYERRFFQLSGNRLMNCEHIEGRFSPEKSGMDNYRKINKIKEGWSRFEKEIGKEMQNIDVSLKVVAHFIKCKDRPVDKKKFEFFQQIRHMKLRIDNWTKAHALLDVRKQEKIKNFLVGIDAAANELEAPPEVFAPAFRMLRRGGVEKFTYHAGEDFHHLIGGMRAVYEVVEFLDLKHGDRIGHATAAGIDPDLWLSSVGRTLYIKKGEWLDDLVFAHHIISDASNRGQEEILFDLQSEILKLAEEIYENNFTVHSLTKAWLSRKYCPVHILTDHSLLKRHCLYDPSEFELLSQFRGGNQEKTLLKKYHTAYYRNKYDEMMHIDINTAFCSAQVLNSLQEIVLKILHDREIILEALPTSNTRISFYNKYSQHHIWRWLGINQDKPLRNMPPVVLGTDDAGIFATNIFNEYCHVYNYLVSEAKMSHYDAMIKIKRLDEDSRVYRFSNPTEKVNRSIGGMIFD